MGTSVLTDNSDRGRKPFVSLGTSVNEDELLKTLMGRGRTDLALKLDAQGQALLVDRIIRDFLAGVSSNEQFRKDHAKYIQNWRMTPELSEENSGPLGEKSANIKVALTSTFIEQWKSRLMKALLGSGDIAQFESLDESLYPDSIQETSDWFQWELENVVRFPEILEDILHYTLLDGFALPIPSYEREERETAITREFDLSDELPIEQQIDDALGFIFQGEEIIDKAVLEIGTYQVTLKHCDDPAYVRFLIEESLLVAEVKRNEVVFDGVKVTCPNIEDIVVVNSSPDIEALHFFGIRMWLTVSQFKELRGEGRLFEKISPDDYESLIASRTEKTQQFVPIENTKASDKIEGTNSLTAGGLWDEERAWIEVYRWEGIHTFDGKRTPCVVWIAPRARLVMAVKRLDDLYKDGKRSPTKFEFIHVPDRFYPIGLAELLQHMQQEMDAIHNYRLNAGTVSQIPFGFYEPNAGMPKDVLALEPGKMYPVKSVKGVLFPQIPFNSIWGFNEEGLSRKYASEAAGMGDMGAGTFTSKRLSASEFAGTEGSIDIRTELIVRRMIRSLTDLLYRIFGLYQLHAKTGRIYQVSGLAGESVVKRLDKDRLNGRMLLKLTANIQQLSPQLERDLATNMLSILLNQVFLQMGIVKPDTLYAAVQKIAKAFNYRGVPLHAPDTVEDSPPPDVEHLAMRRGEAVSPHPGENFNMHLTSHMRLASDPNIERLIPDPVVRELLAQHIKETISLRDSVAQMRQMQAQQAMQAQMSMERMGIRPGMPGGQQTGNGAAPATPEEGLMAGGDGGQSVQTGG